MPAPVPADAALGGSPAKATPSWATPGRLLLLFCLMCLFIYLDRGEAGSQKQLHRGAD